MKNTPHKRRHSPMKISKILKESYKDPYRKQVLIFKDEELVDQYSSYKILEQRDIDIKNEFIYNALRHQLIICLKNTPDTKTENYYY